jgi:stage II sporulation protein AB (anti-sigma F factor)
MECINEISVKMLSKSANEGLARVIISAMASQLDPTIDEIVDIKTAVSEAVTNSIIHGYGGRAGEILIECRLFEKSIEIVIIDYGKGIEDIEKAREPLFTTSPELERSGMGFTVMETFMDEITVESAVGMGTKVRMVKNFKSLERE